MDYEKRCQELVEAIKQLQETNPSDEGIQNWANDTLYRVKETDNDRIRKLCEELIESSFINELCNKEERDVCINWLEAQGEQKSANEIEPKFHKGEWITNGQLTCKVLSVTNKSYELHLYNDDYCHFETDVQSVDKTFHLWSIEDAIDGDVVLSIYNQPFIYNGIFDEENVGAYCGIDKSGDYFLKSVLSCQWSYKEGVKPATKEQCALLFSKMHEAGYEWDSKNKELVKIENTNEEEDLEKEEERKELISLFKNKIISSKENSSDVEFYKKALLWLEKQGETSPVLLNTGKHKKMKK